MKPTHTLPGHACVLCLLASSAFAADVVIAGPLESIPSDVSAIADRQIQCREWMMLEITNEGTDTAAELALTRLRCDSLAADMSALRNKYSQSSATLHAIDVAGTIGP